MKTISELLADDKVGKEISDKMQALVQETGGKLVLFDHQNQTVASNDSPLGLAVLVDLHRKVQEKVAREWEDVRQAALSRRQPFFIEDCLGLVAFAVPVEVAGKFWGMLVGHGGFFDDGRGEEGQRQAKERLYYQLELDQEKVAAEDFQEAVAGIKFISPDALEKKACYIPALLGLLAEPSSSED